MTIYPKIAEVNCETGEQITREPTEYEKAEYDVRAAEQAAQIQAAKTEPTILEKLDSIGVTIPELKAALGL